MLDQEIVSARKPGPARSGTGRAPGDGRPRRWLAGATATLAALAAVVVQAGTAAPASAVPGLIQVIGGASPNGAWSTGLVSCPTGRVPLGGGARIFDNTGTVMLMGMRTSEAGFAASAAAPVGSAANVALQIYAICALAPAGLEYIYGEGVTSSSTFKHEIVGCPSGKQVISTGAWITGGSDVGGGPASVGLTLVRHDGAMTLARASAREIAGGYSGSWQVDPSVVCAFPLSGQVNNAKVVNGSTATVGCHASAPVHGAGGGGAIFDTGPQFLQSLYADGLLVVYASMTATPPGGGMVAAAICAT